MECQHKPFHYACFLKEHKQLGIHFHCTVCGEAILLKDVFEYFFG